MARPVKSRTICSEPKINIFGPRNLSEEIYVDMSLEEFEAIRLIDYNNLTQEECASFMGVARTTVQKIYDDARGKIADALVNGRTLKIEVEIITYVIICHIENTAIERTVRDLVNNIWRKNKIYEK